MYFLDNCDKNFKDLGKRHILIFAQYLIKQIFLDECFINSCAIIVVNNSFRVW